MSKSKATFAKLASRRRHLFSLVEKVKLWTSRSGCLHGVRSVRLVGDWVEVETHCGISFRVRDSKSSRAKRQIKHGYYRRVCKKCKIPDWKIDKYRKSTMR